MIETAIKLYNIKSSQFKKTGWSPCQAAVYAEIAEFMRKECATIEEATEKIKNSHLYLAPSVALVKDKINALIRAAEDDEIEGVADVYRKKLVEIDKDPSAINDATCFTTAHNLYVKHFARIDAFMGIYKGYLELEACLAPLEPPFEVTYSSFRSAWDDLERYGGDFAVCASRPEFREVIPISDAAYQRFVNDATKYRANPSAAESTPMLNDAVKRVNAIKNRLYPEQREQMRKEIEEKCRNQKNEAGACLVVAPPDENGDYEYTEIITFKK